MTVPLTPHTGETTLAFHPVPGVWSRDRGFRFGFLVTDQAIYLPATRPGFHVTEGLQSIRIPLLEISRVAVAPARIFPPLTLFYVGSLLFFTFIGFSLLSSGSRLSQAFFFPLMLLPGTLRAVLGAPGRLRLTVSAASGPFEFLPAPDALPFPPARHRARAAQTAFLQACRQVGLPTDPDPAASLASAPNPGVQRTRFARR